MENRLNIDLDYVNPIENREDIYENVLVGEYWVWLLDKFIIFTKNKIGSRYLGQVLSHNKNYKCWSGIVNFDINFNVQEEYTTTQYDGGYTKQDFINEMKLVSQKKSIKEVIFIYRNPIDRCISGIIQEFHACFKKEHGRFNEFNNITNELLLINYDLKKYGRFLRNPNYIKNFDLMHIDSSDMDNFLKFMLDWYSKTIELGIENFRHTDKFCETYFRMIDIWDSNKIILIDLDYGHKHVLKAFLHNVLDFKFSSKDEEYKTRESNGTMVQFFGDLPKSLAKISNDIEEDFGKYLRIWENCQFELNSQLQNESWYYSKLQQIEKNNYHHRI